MTGAYRDTRDAVRAQLVDLHAQIAAREGTVTEVFWRSLPAALHAALDTLTPACTVREDDPLEVLAAAQDACEKRLALLDEALALLPSLERSWNDLPDVAPPPDVREPGLLESRTPSDPGEVSALTEQLRTLARRHDAGAEVSAPNPTLVLARFRASAAPYLLVARLWVGADPQLVLGTSVRAATPPLRVRPEGLLDGIIRSVGGRRDVEFGEQDFDGYFFVRPDEPAARALLTATVRSALLEIAREDVPTLEVRGGAARLSWTFAPTARALDAAVRALGELRRAPVYARLRR